MSEWSKVTFTRLSSGAFSSHRQFTFLQQPPTTRSVEGSSEPISHRAASANQNVTLDIPSEKSEEWQPSRLSWQATGQTTVNRSEVSLKELV